MKKDTYSCTFVLSLLVCLSVLAANLSLAQSNLQISKSGNDFVVKNHKKVLERTYKKYKIKVLAGVRQSMLIAPRRNNRVD